MSRSVESSYTSEDGTITCSLTYEHLDVAEVTEWVGADEAGALALFVGTTRNSFQGRKVKRLEYEAYSQLAMRTMIEILEEARRLADAMPSQHKTPSHAPPLTPSASSSAIPAPIPPTSLIKLALHHRLGTVPVGKPSIIIAVASPHRKEAFVACEWILEEVKRRVQVWKKEVYAGASDLDSSAMVLTNLKTDAGADSQSVPQTQKARKVVESSGVVVYRDELEEPEEEWEWKANVVYPRTEVSF